MKNIFSKTTAEKRTQNGVKTESKRTNYGYTILLFAFLTLGFGQAWADNLDFSGNSYIFIKNIKPTGWGWGSPFIQGASGEKDYLYVWGNNNASGYTATAVLVEGSANTENAVYAVKMPSGNYWGLKLARGNSINISSTWNETGDMYFVKGKNYLQSYGNEGQSWSTYVPTSTASLSVNSTSITTIQTATLTPSLSSNTAYNEIKSTTYSVTTNPGSAGSVTSAGVFSATAAGTYIVTATVTYNAKDFSDITKTATATKTITVTAAAETTYEVTFNAGANGSISAKGTAISAGSNATIQIGATARPLTATPSDGYRFAGWTKTGSVTIADESSDNTTVSATGTGTVTATWAAKTPVRLYFSNPDGWATVNAYVWKDATTVTDKNYDWPGVAITTNTVVDNCNTFYYYEYYKEDHPDWNRVIFNDGSSNQTSDITFSNTTNNGQYYVGSSWTATPGSRWALAHSIDSYNTTTHPLTCASTTSGSVDVELAGNTDYDFKLVDTYTNAWYGVSSATEITYSNKGTAQTMSNTTGGCANQTMKTAGKGTYTFTWNITNKQVTITYPTSYTVTFGVGTIKGNSRTITAYEYGHSGDNAYKVNSGDYVTTGTQVQFYAGANEPADVAAAYYGWKGFYSDADATTSQLASTTAYSPTITDNTTVYACFYEIAYGISSYIEGQGTITANNGWNAYVATKVSFTATPGTGYKFDNWTQRSGALTIASPYNATTNVNATEASTLQANFSPRYAVRAKTGGGDWSAESANHLTGYGAGQIGYVDITLNANTDYEIQVYDRETNTWYGGSATQNIYYANSNTEFTIATTSSPQSVFIKTGAAGTYRFAWNLTGYKIAVEYPTSRFIEIGQNIAEAGSVTAVDGESNTIVNGQAIRDGGSITFTAATNTGYNFSGWFDNEGCTTGQYTAGTNVEIDGNAMTLSSINADKTVYAKFVPKTYTVTLTQTGAKTEGSTSATATYNAVLPGITLPTPNDGYAFMGYYSAEDGEGRQFINPSGEWVANAGDTISDSKWIRDGGITLYAYYKKAEITALTFDAAVVAPSASVGVTPTVAPTPAGTNSICWKLLYNNGNLYTPQPTFSPENPGGVGNKVTFNAPSTSGMYLVAAVLRTGSSCDGGTKLDSVTYPFQVAGDHTVTMQYKCGNTTIAASTTTIGRPLVWSSAIAAPEIFGYTFHHWLAGDGVTLSEDGENAKTGERADSSVVSSIYIKAIYDGKLTAVYTQENIIYFKDNLGWTDPADPDAHVYVNLLTTDKWTNNKGTGNSGVTNRNLTMNRVEGTTDIFYYNYGNKSVTYVSFTKESMDNYDYFHQESPNVAHVVFPTRYADALTTNKVSEAGFKAMTPMFVPLEGQTGIKQNDDRADYYNRGYWTMYTPGTGYTLEIYNEYGNSLLKSIAFTSEDDLMPMKAVADLEAGHNYKYQIRRGGTGSDGVYYGNSGTMTYADHGQSTAWDMSNPPSFSMAGIEANAAGDYIFHLSYSTYGDVDAYRLRIAVDYPIAGGDYRVIYKDDVHTSKPSAIVTNANYAKDTVSFFIRHNQNPSMKIQQATVDGETGAITWNDVEGGTVDLSSITQTGVYNICLTMDGSGAISVENKEPYTGNFYIRTDCAVSKWDNYKNADHLMTYSLYSEEHSDFSHYFMGHVYGGTNVKFVVANDYSPCISDTLIVSTYRGGDAAHVWDSDGSGHGAGDLKADEANIRFMWNRANNAVYRAYLAPAQSDGSNFLVLRGTTDDNLMDENGNPLRNASNSEQDGYNHKAPDYCIQFVDDENWIYEATVQVEPSSYVKLYALFNSGYFYYKGTKDDIFDDSHAIKLVEGSGDAVKVRVIYDFKTDRLVAAYMPSGNIDEQMAINADVMFIREHQGDIDQLTFSEKDSKMGAITDIKTAYAVMRFNKWTLNNKDKNTHEVLDNPKSIYERSLYYVSFPFPVNLNEVFGFGTYGQHWIIQRYRGDLRAQQGFWAESAGFWEFIWNRNGVVLQPNEGYILTLETELLGETSDVWGPESVANQVELYFPSTGSLGSITNASITQTLPAHTCTINRAATEGLPDTSDPSTSYNRTIFDSHWNIMSVPTYVNVNNPSFANTTWIGGDEGNVGPKFLYTWNPDDNTLTATSGTGFVYHAMHAYTVQYYGNVTWTTSVTPTAAPQRNTEYRGEYEFCLEVQQDEQMIDRTFVRLSDDEKVTTGFEFGEDMTKQFNSRKANIFTIAGNTSLGGNSLPLSTTQTTVVPVGVSIKSAGDYTFAIPEGTEGIGVTLVDNETGVRTSLSALDYTVTLQPGNITDRFVLEISPIHNTPTGLEEPTSDSTLKGRAQKVMIDGILYIVKDGKIFDARGARVE